MKNKQLFIILAMFSSLASNAQVTYKYSCSNTLKEKSGIGADLVPYCTGTYVSATLPAGPKKTVYQFNKGCGLGFSDSVTNLLASGSYTIELYFKFDTVTGYKKIIDFDNLTLDKGFYSWNSKLNLYPNYTATDSNVFAGTWQYVVLTRDAATKKMYLYHNNKVAGSYNDSSSSYIYGTNKRLVFFRDDNGTGQENSSGNVAMIYITNTTMDSNTIKSRYANLGNTLGVSEMETVGSKVAVYPNPVSDYVFVSIEQKCSYTISGISGNILMKNTLQQGQNKISISNLQPGMYILKLTDVAENKVFKLLKQ